ncbi:MAG TPA: hypothetical protein VKA50_00555 [Gammaproteobacteria bacterium]|nr:hypothetical protein [Gammaproteobacteria bacterium]
MTTRPGNVGPSPNGHNVEDKAAERGVYWVGAGGVCQRVHLYQGGDYALEDIGEFFSLGQAVPPSSLTPLDMADEITSALHLSAAELRELKVFADSQSFDFEPPFIEMCLEMYRFCIDRPEDKHLFVADF